MWYTASRHNHDERGAALEMGSHHLRYGSFIPAHNWTCSLPSRREGQTLHSSTFTPWMLCQVCGALLFQRLNGSEELCDLSPDELPMPRIPPATSSSPAASEISQLLILWSLQSMLPSPTSVATSKEPSNSTSPTRPGVELPTSTPDPGQLLVWENIQATPTFNPFK